MNAPGLIVRLLTGEVDMMLILQAGRRPERFQAGRRPERFHGGRWRRAQKFDGQVHERPVARNRCAWVPITSLGPNSSRSRRNTTKTACAWVCVGFVSCREGRGGVRVRTIIWETDSLLRCAPNLGRANGSGRALVSRRQPGERLRPGTEITVVQPLGLQGGSRKAQVQTLIAIGIG